MATLVILMSVLGLLKAADVADYPVVYCHNKLWETEKWSLHITHTDQGADVKECVSSLSVDVIGQRIAASETGTRNGQPYSISYLFYYPAQTVYLIQNGQCEARPLTGNFSQHCRRTPNYRYDVEMVHEMIGSYGPNQGPVFTQGARGIDNGVGYFYNMDLEYVIPFMTERNGVIAGVPTYTLDNYYNMTFDIKDPTVFTPPENCIKTN